MDTPSHQSLQTGVNFQCMQYLTTRLFEIHPLYSQQTELYAMLLFCYYDSVRNSLNNEMEELDLCPVDDSDSHVKNASTVFAAAVGEEDEEFIQAERKFLDQVLAIVVAAGLEGHNESLEYCFGRWTRSELFGWLGHKLAEIVEHCQKELPTRTAIFIPDTGDLITKYGVSQYTVGIIQFMLQVGRELFKLVTYNVPRACTIHRGIVTHRLWRSLLFTDSVECGYLKEIHYDVVARAKVTHGNSAPYLTTEDKTRIRFFADNCVSMPYLLRNLPPAEPPASLCSDFIKLVKRGVPEFGATPTTLSYLPLFVFWPILAHVFEESGLFKQQRLNFGAGVPQAFASFFASFVRPPVACLARLIKTQEYRRIVAETVWPPDDIIAGTKRSLPVTETKGIESFGWLLGPKLARTYVDLFKNPQRGVIPFFTGLANALDLVAREHILSNDVSFIVMRSNLRILNKFTTALLSDVGQCTRRPIEALANSDQALQQTVQNNNTTTAPFGCTFEFIRKLYNQEFVLDSMSISETPMVENNETDLAKTTTTVAPFAAEPKPPRMSIGKRTDVSLDSIATFYNPRNQPIEEDECADGSRVKKLKAEVWKLLNEINSCRKTFSVPLLWVVDESELDKLRNIPNEVDEDDGAEASLPPPTTSANHASPRNTSKLQTPLPIHEQARQSLIATLQKYKIQGPFSADSSATATSPSSAPTVDETISEPGPLEFDDPEESSGVEPLEKQSRKRKRSNAETDSLTLSAPKRKKASPKQSQTASITSERPQRTTRTKSLSIR